ncbi:MAG: PorV/PorQ family protein [Elusimicrobia bacterium]|nr:PorV/PorQ family protein [Elusimicrobiota bacterium]
MKCLDSGTKKDVLNSIIYWLSRPYALLLAAAFLLTPSSSLLHALESGADFLNIGAASRASAMGSAYTAMAADPTAMYYNPGGLALSARGAAITHSAWALGGSYDFAAAAFPVAGLKAGVSFTRLDHGSLDGRGADGSSSGGFSASDKALGLGLAGSSGGFSLGAAVKFLSSDIAGYGASAVAFDLGAVHKLASSPLKLGLAVRNLGSGFKYAEKREALPLSMSAGASLAVLPTMNLAAEFTRMVNERRNTFSIGTEYALLGGLALRGGYAASASGSQGAMSGGIGFSAGSMKLDYSFSPFGDFDTTRKLSLAMAF